MFLLKLGSKLQNLVKKLPCAMKILANYRLHFHEVEYFHKVECTGESFPEWSLMGWNFPGENFLGGNFPRIQ